MPGVALYNALTKLGLQPNEAKEAVADVTSSKEVATKADIKDMATKVDLKTGLAELETRLVKQMYGVAVLIVVLVVGLIKYL